MMISSINHSKNTKRHDCMVSTSDCVAAIVCVLHFANPDIFPVLQTFVLFWRWWQGGKMMQHFFRSIPSISFKNQLPSVIFIIASSTTTTTVPNQHYSRTSPGHQWRSFRSSTCNHSYLGAVPELGKPLFIGNAFDGTGGEDKCD